MSVCRGRLRVQAARALGHYLADQHITLVYGGGTVGLMGEIAKTVQSRLGNDKIIGVIPEALQKREVRGAARPMRLIGATGGATVLEGC